MTIRRHWPRLTFSTGPSRPDKFSQFSEEQLRSLARRRCPAERVWEITNATRAELVVMLESAKVRP